MRRILITVVGVLHLLLLDAVTKEIAVAHLKDAPAVSVISGLLNFAYVENRGCAWGMLQGRVWPLAVFAVVALGLCVWKRRDVFSLGASNPCVRRAGAVAECLLYAGIIGNLIDRVFRGCVVDFIDFHWGGWHFPCFNVADICITCAAGILILVSFIGPARKDESAVGRESGTGM